MLRALAGQFKEPSGLIGLVVSKFLYSANKGIYREMERRLDLRDGLSLMEIGFGPGFGIERFLGGYDVVYHGYELSELMFERARRRFRRQVEDGRLFLTRADYLDVPAGSGLYDRVVFANVTYFWEDLVAPFSKIRGELRPGGKLVFYMDDAALLSRDRMTEGTCFHRHELGDVLGRLGSCGYRDIVHSEILGEASGQFVIEALA